MRVSRIEIFGFKSFMERLVLPLEGGVTGIVGPNGCGKSNIVDALRWVLGETRASSLRGGVLEDVIFNGTDKLRPLGLAEVTLSLRASDADFFSDLVSGDEEAELIAAQSEEPIEEEISADGESEVQEAVAPAGDPSMPDKPGIAGGESPPQLRVIQGGIGQEEADAGAEPAGLSAEDARAALREDRAAQRASLSARFAWLKAVSEVQVTRRLYRSGESEFFINRVNCRLRDVKDFFRAVGLSARAYTIVAQGEVSRIVTSRPEERRQILEEAAGVIGLREKIAAAGRRLDETAINISRLDDLIKEVSRQVGSLKRQAAIARNRQDLRREIRDHECAIFRSRLRELAAKREDAARALDHYRSQEGALHTAVELASVEEHSARSELLAIDVRGDELRSQVDSLREELAARLRQRSERTARISELRAFALARETEIRRLEERLATLVRRREEAVAEVDGLRSEEASARTRLEQVEKVGDDDLKAVVHSLRDLREGLRRHDHTMREVRDRLIAAKSKADAIAQQIVSLSPMSQLKKTLGAQSREFLEGLSNETRLFVDSLKVPHDIARAVQAVLGERAAFLVAESPYVVGQRFVERLVSSPSENRHGLALGVLRGSIAPLPAPQSVTPASLPVLLDQITVTEEHRGLAQRVFWGVYLAEDVAQAAQFLEGLSESERDRCTVVTRSGEILTAYSFFSFRHEGGVVQLKSSHEELLGTVSALDAEQRELQTQRDRMQSEIGAAETRHSELLREVQQRQAQVREMSNLLGNIRGKLHASERLIEQVRHDMERTEQQTGEARQRIAEFTAEAARLQEEMNQLTGDRDEEVQRTLKELSAQYAEVDGVRRKGRENLSRVVDALETKRRELDKVRTGLNEAALLDQRAALEVENHTARMSEEYGAECVADLIADGGPVLGTEERENALSEVARLKARIQREGEVDPTAIERFESESARLTELEAQKHDLEHAATTLKSTIRRLTETSQRRFLATFEAVRENFSRLIPRLFGGGRGDLTLLDPANPLDSGVEIVARPPGKKLKSIDLMSGGEKALCATALIFSMFLVRPSPLCVLDEVDAPLDEANLERFLGLIKEMSSRIQFLMITHNKSSMSASDTLVGVTMQEPGASSVISVTLQEAFQQVA